MIFTIFGRIRVCDCTRCDIAANPLGLFPRIGILQESLNAGPLFGLPVFKRSTLLLENRFVFSTNPVLIFSQPLRFRVLRVGRCEVRPL